MSQGSPYGHRNPNNGSNPSLGGNSGAFSSQPRPSNLSGPSPASRAERFEDEKRRIIESCFNKQEPNGQLAESYITHIRIIEDGQYPSSPPPPDNSQEHKKPRLIIIAVRSTGRVRMHKARENNNGSFSIGKTWNMEELSAIESFSGSAPPQSEREAQAKAWAGSVGFIVTVTKPYYWQASTTKEKDFFISSIVRIYRKYTKGQIPELRGFDEQQKSAILGTSLSQQAQRRNAPQNGGRGIANGDDIPAPPRPPFSAGAQERDPSRYRESPGPPPSLSDRGSRAPSATGVRAPSAEGRSPARFNESVPPSPKPFATTEHLRSQGSRDGLYHDSRPGTAPNNGAYRGSPLANEQGSPYQPPYQAHPSQNSVSGSTQSARDRTRSPLRNEGFQGAQAAMASLNGAAGAELFARSRQRLADYQQHDTSPLTSSTFIPQLPPAEPVASSFSAQERQTSPARRSSPKRQDSDHSSQNDPNAFPTVSDFESFPKIVASTPPTALPSTDIDSPPTPERSKRRPPLDAPPSDASIDLRPAPLNARNKTSQQGSTQSTPRDLTPAPEEVKSLSPIRDRFDFGLPDINGPLAASQEQPVTSTPALTPLEDSEREAPRVREVTQEEDEKFRPGLGPMIKKKAVAERFKRAANAANAFKPRPGGAAEKILKAKAEREASGTSTQPDGITGVMPAPQKEEVPITGDVQTPTNEVTNNRNTPVVELTLPTSPDNNASKELSNGMDGMSRGAELRTEAPRLVKSPELLQQEDEESEPLVATIQQPKLKRRSAQQLRYLEELGVGSSLLADRCIGFETTLYDFGWVDAQLSSKALAKMENDLRREQTRLEAGAWLSSPALESHPSKDDREKQVLSLLDRAIQECDEMDSLLTIYNVELSTLNDDVSFIEAQSQGLQVQSANQQLLHSELSGLLQTMSLDKRTLEPLRRTDLSNPRSLEHAETTLAKLYQAIVTITPNAMSTHVGKRKSRGIVNEGNELANMTALRKKREVYERESNSFCRHLVQHLESAFTATFDHVKASALEPAGAAAVKLRKTVWSEARQSLWIYGPLILYTKELNQPAWQSLVHTYQSRAHPAYMEVFGKNMSSWKRAIRKSGGDESDILFTAQEKEDAALGSGALNSARKLTVKRSHTLAKTLRHATAGDRHGSSDSRATGSLMSSEIFAGSFDEMAVLVSHEQNFIVDLFHITSLESGDFIDAISATRPEDRQGTNLQAAKPIDPDREMVRFVTNTMGEIFGFFANELNSLLDWTLSSDPLQGVGVMACLNRHAYFLAEGNQDFLIRLIEQLLARLQNLFTKFVQEQVRAIEETKVKIKKREGLIGFIKTFPNFSSAVENVFSTVAGPDYESEAQCMYETRRTIDDAYHKINRAMFDSLKIIAKESPSAIQQPSAAAKSSSEDPEDKEVLNHHILIIENMNHYTEEVDDRGKEGVLAEWRGKALLERAEAMDMYVGRVIRRPLGKLLDFLDSLDSVKEAHPQNPAAITSRPTYSRKAARSIFAQHDSKEIRRGIETLRKRIEKHFGDADNEANSRALVTLVCKECERAYDKAISRSEHAIRELYPPAEGEKPVELEFSKADVQAGFRK